MSKKTAGRVVLITGGSSGIGEATALLFAKQGASIAITFQNNYSGAKKVVSRIQKAGGHGFAIKANLIYDHQAKAVVRKVLKHFGRIDVLVNNAGRYIDGDEWNGKHTVWIKSLQQNLVLVMSVSKYVIPIFQKQKSGVMISVASRYSTDGQYDALAYAAAKAGIANITQAYAKLLSPFGRANAISPTSVRTGYWLHAPREEVAAQKRLIEPESVAKKIVFLASEKSTHITGQNIPVNE